MSHTALSPKPCFIILPGLAPDPLSVMPIKTYLEAQGYTAIVTNFCGNNTTKDFSKLTIDDCLRNVAKLVRDAKKKHAIVVGIGISLGGALLIEHAKTHSDLDYVASIGTPFRLKKSRLISLGVAFSPVLHPIWKFFDKSQRLRPLPVVALPMAMRFFEGRFLENLDGIRNPVIFMHSRRDPATDYKAMLAGAKKIVNARTEIILTKKGDHQMNYDPVVIMNNVFAFLQLPDYSVNYPLPSGRKSATQVPA